MGGVNSTEVRGVGAGGCGIAGSVQVSVALQTETAQRPGWRSVGVCTQNELTHNALAPRLNPPTRASPRSSP